jgi:hypothetical protein
VTGSARRCPSPVAAAGLAPAALAICGGDQNADREASPSQDSQEGAPADSLPLDDTARISAAYDRVEQVCRGLAESDRREQVGARRGRPARAGGRPARAGGRPHGGLLASRAAPGKRNGPLGGGPFLGEERYCYVMGLSLWIDEGSLVGPRRPRSVVLGLCPAP